ncbi:DNA cytosine methyltransferase [Paenibacillus sp. A3]|uniref:DNA cytosine methyltransferase n=1 Tax=Paenibacillus sp. A3 TaxID=1337054 RepID=UPI0009E9DBD4|nr:DNA cytosine methyltransferase [Paenibacillus sp. A3]
MDKKFTAIDLFSGAGGVSEALKNLFEIKCAVEYDPIIAKTYELNHGNKHLIVEDIRNITKDLWLEKVALPKESLDLLIGTPPCQGFSKHSRKKSNNNFDGRNTLILEVLRVADIYFPKFIFFENVDNIVNYSIFHLFLKRLSNVDRFGFKKNLNRPSYHIRYEVVDASDYGVPQRRKRMILIAKRIDSFPNTEAVIKHPRNGTPYVSNPLNLWPLKIKAESLGKYLKSFNLAPLSAGEADPTDPLHKCRNLSEINLKRIRNTKPNGGSRSDWPKELILDCHKQKNISFGDVYGRMNNLDYAPTITCGCLAYSKGRFGHPTEDRAISIREAALIQTFPKNYKFTGNLLGSVNEGSSENIATQIGNAVPVQLAKAFLKAIHTELRREYSALSIEALCL